MITVNNGIYNSSNGGEIRVYKSATITITAPTGNVIKEAVFTCSSSNPASNMTGDGYSKGTFTSTDGVTSFTLTASVAQCRIQKIVIQYKAS